MDGISRSPWARWAPFAIVALVGLVIRVPRLDVRPMHTDEAVNAYIVGQLFAGETFNYDPQDRHGPALAALALPLARMQGARSFSDLSESELRLAPVVAGTVTILLFGAAVEMFGYFPSLLAAMMFALAPLPVYYDRYFIHEPLLCAATFALILSAWRAGETRSVGYAALGGGCAAIMFACKETAILHVIALALAALLFRNRNQSGQKFAASSRARALLAAAGTFLAILTILFTWFGRSWNALPAIAHAVPDFIARAAGQGHQKPFWYYGWLLSGGWSGGLLVALACLGFIISVRKPSPSAYALLAYYAFCIAAFYSFIPYKTPWVALNVWLPLALFAARAVELLWREAEKRLSLHMAITTACIFGMLAFALIAHDTRERVFLGPADENNPYAYAHTSEDILGLPAEIADMARRNGMATPRIAVIAVDPWPLPWYLRHFNQVGFWQPGQKVGSADFFITSTEAAGQYAAQLRDFRPEFFGVRPGVLILLWSPAPR